MNKTFQIKSYNLKTEKISSGKRIRIAFLTDLHGLSYGENNERLLRAIEEEATDLVISTGDMNVAKDIKTLDVGEVLMLQLSGKYPVYYALGNHEAKLLSEDSEERTPLQTRFAAYCSDLANSGIRFLLNERERIVVNGEEVVISGLNLPLQYYKKPFAPCFKLQEMTEFLGRPDPHRFHILAAHNPRFGTTYFNWGADLILCGHYHGGMLRFSENFGAISPHLIPFPRYCCGRIEKNNSTMIVSGGLGEHTIPIRINNPRELVIIQAEGV